MTQDAFPALFQTLIGRSLFFHGTGHSDSPDKHKIMAVYLVPDNSVTSSGFKIEAVVANSSGYFRTIDFKDSRWRLSVTDYETINPS